MVDEYLDEREQAQQLKQWFKENWLWLATGIALGLGGLYGWQAWNDHLDGRSREAGARFTEMLAAFERADRARGEELAAQITGEYASTPYADQAELVLARVYADAGELDQAAARLKGVMDQSGDEELALVARLRLARVQMAQGSHDAALATLDGVSSPAVAATVADLRGDVLFAKGDHAAALAAYRQALEAAGPEGQDGLVDRRVLQLKIDALSTPGTPDEGARS